MTRPFTDAEHAARLRRVQAVLAERSLAALVVADPANLYYLTGYNAWSFYTPQCLVVPATGLPHLFARAMDAHGGHLRVEEGPSGTTCFRLIFPQRSRSLRPATASLRRAA